MSLIVRVNQLEREVKDNDEKIRAIYLEVGKLIATSESKESLLHLQRILEDFFPFLK